MSSSMQSAADDSSLPKLAEHECLEMDKHTLSAKIADDDKVLALIQIRLFTHQNADSGCQILNLRAEDLNYGELLKKGLSKSDVK